MVFAEQPCEYAVKHEIAHLKRVNYTVCELYL